MTLVFTLIFLRSNFLASDVLLEDLSFLAGIAIGFKKELGMQSISVKNKLKIGIIVKLRKKLEEKKQRI